MVASPIPAPTGAPGALPDRWTLHAFSIVALCFAINMADGIDVTILSFIAPRIQDDWKIGADVMGNLFSAGLLGMAIGGMGIAPMADRFGRRRIILIALGLMSGGMLASGLVSQVVELLVLRVIVGAGIGTVLASMAALAAERAPAHHANLAVGIVQAGYPFAAVFTGLVVAQLLPIMDWQHILAGAGVLTLVLLPMAFRLLDEDVVARSGGVPAGNRVAALFQPAFRMRTLALWGAVFSGLMVLYFIVSWIPKLSIEAGLSETNGIYAGALYNLGAFVGTSAMSVLAVRVPLGRLVPIMLLGAGVAMLIFGSIEMSVAMTLFVAFLIGVLLQGGYNGVWPLAASVYPGEFRATGIGWAIGIGRSGAIIGPLLGGYLLAAQVSLPVLFASYCVPLLACSACVLAVSRFSRAKRH
ncbi:MFS transporter [Novosphingobium pentaromativorans]|uniref:Major facilitator superfamily MFS_1 n=1 Tax=Novosphingobium pentaromativorans US6-1 TaxID=1088721 RepID=G6EG81_9SPHN|nr:MFS transporter [Novosphingobium pentaromativorans]AIT82231.1 MFS transporter [Novosphingobium pentaromativorans US6-1]EHJ59770.1 major facilitator superfamily MFS_1 [Novosphingobium pentaromativorans US6-1]